MYIYQVVYTYLINNVHAHDLPFLSWKPKSCSSYLKLLSPPYDLLITPLWLPLSQYAPISFFPNFTFPPTISTPLLSYFYPNFFLPKFPLIYLLLFLTPFLSLFLSLLPLTLSQNSFPLISISLTIFPLSTCLSPLSSPCSSSLSSSCLSCTNLINFWQRHGKEKAKFSLCLFTPYSSFFSQIITSSSSHIHTGCPKSLTPCDITFE